jgi:hypothetical protein
MPNKPRPKLREELIEARARQPVSFGVKMLASSDFLFELLIVALDTPTRLRQVEQRHPI